MYNTLKQGSKSKTLKETNYSFLSAMFGCVRSKTCKVTNETKPPKYQVQNHDPFQGVTG